MDKRKKATLGNPKKGEEGNTDSSPSRKKQPSRHTFWCFTLNNYDVDDLETVFQNRLMQIGNKIIYGREKAPSTGTPHLQGFIALKEPMRLTELKLPGFPHLEHCKGSEDQNTKYCRKDGDVWKSGYPPDPKPLKLITPDKPWQLEILEILKKEPDDRLVHWFWSKEGRIGKSSFCKYLVAKHNCVFIDEGKKADIMFTIIEANMDICDTVVFDIPRANGNNVSYKSIESIKNGMIYSSKYESGYKLFNSPHVIIFANEEPDIKKLSDDRWVITNIDPIITD